MNLLVLLSGYSFGQNCNDCSFSDVISCGECNTCYWNGGRCNPQLEQSCDRCSSFSDATGCNECNTCYWDYDHGECYSEDDDTSLHHYYHIFWGCIFWLLCVRYLWYNERFQSMNGCYKFLWYIMLFPLPFLVFFWTDCCCRCCVPRRKYDNAQQDVKPNAKVVVEEPQDLESNQKLRF